MPLEIVKYSSPYDLGPIFFAEHVSTSQVPCLMQYLADTILELLEGGFLIDIIISSFCWLLTFFRNLSKLIIYMFWVDNVYEWHKKNILTKVWCENKSRLFICTSVCIANFNLERSLHFKCCKINNYANNLMLYMNT